MILTLKELADYLRVNERTILRMLKSGQVQGAKIGGQWRFNGSQIHGLFFPQTGPGDQPQELPLTELPARHLRITMSRVMSTERMVMDMTATDVGGVMRELADPAFLNTLVLDVRGLRQQLLDREHLLSTGVGNGIAVPHPRDPISTLRAPAVIVFGRSVKGVEYEAADSKLVHLFFLLCCQTIELHLHLMGRLANLLRNTSFIDALRECSSPDEVMRQVLAQERQQFLASE